MKQVVVNEFLDDLAVHPPAVYDRLVELSVASAQELRTQADQFVQADWPTGEAVPAFEKHGYRYYQDATHSLFVNPRPSPQQMAWYLKASEAATYRASSDYTDQTSNHIDEHAYYRADWVSSVAVRIRLPEDRPLIDVQTRHRSLLKAMHQFELGPIIVSEPLIDPSDELQLTQADTLASLKGSEARLVTAFNVIEHESQPLAFVKAAYEALDQGGYFLLTTRSASGFDILTLWEHATVFPLEHINLISVEGMQALLTTAGFEIVEISTPGQLDVQLVESVLERQPDLELPRLWRYFLSNRDEQAKRGLQQYLQQNRLSSYLRVVARKA
ncbi:MAG: class I SAM-dependent methyltransferase [Chloroflexi bacterium]|nr:class I SAM-dependent methyltransferase [Chloroflexota bacterium]